MACNYRRNYNTKNGSNGFLSRDNLKYQVGFKKKVSTSIQILRTLKLIKNCKKKFKKNPIIIRNDITKAYDSVNRDKFLNLILLKILFDKISIYAFNKDSQATLSNSYVNRKKGCLKDQKFHVFYSIFTSIRLSFKSMNHLKYAVSHLQMI